MKNSYTLLTTIPFFLVACAAPTEQKHPVGLKKESLRKQLVGAFVPTRDEDISLPEQIKAYQVGRYVDAGDSNILHDRHTVYRREQSGYWNLAAAKGAGASRSYYLTADNSQQDHQQKAYHEAAQEQTRVAKEKLAASEQKVKALEKENSDLKEKLRPSSLYYPTQKNP